MTTTDVPTLDQVLTLARKLPAADKVRLMARLAPEVDAALQPDDGDDAWNALLRFSDDYPVPPLTQDSADVLSAMRR